MLLERLRGRRSKLLDDLLGESLILELKNGEVFGGRLDEYYYNGGGIISLYYCKSLDKKNLIWRNSNRRLKDGDGEFWLSEVRNIFHLQHKQRERVRELEDVLQIYIDPHYKPLTGIQCGWNPGEKWQNHRHQTECEFRLHEALAFIRTYTTMYANLSKETKWQRKYEDSFAYVRHRLLQCGAKIP